MQKNMGLPARPNLAAQSFIPAQEIYERQARTEELTETVSIGEATNSLASYIDSLWETAKKNKIDIEQLLMKCLRAKNKEYEPNILAALEQVNASKFYMPLIFEKCKDARAIFGSLFLPDSGDDPWGLNPTPIPDLNPNQLEEIKQRVLQEIYSAALLYKEQEGQPVSPEEFNAVAQLHNDEIYDKTLIEIKDEAEKIAERMTLKIKDQLEEGNSKVVFKDLLGDFVDYPACFAKNLVLRKTKILEHFKDETTGEWDTRVVEKVQVNLDRVSPFNIYPLTVSSLEGDVLEHQKLSRQALNDLIGVDGYNETEIRAALNEYNKGLIKDWLWTDTERARLETKTLTTQSQNTGELIDILEGWVSVQGKKLLDWGISKEKIPDPDLEYKACVIKAGTHVIKAVINPDPLGRNPYISASYIRNPDSIWGGCIPTILFELQDSCNNISRATLHNASKASEAVTEMNIDRLADGENTDNIWTGRVLKVTEAQMLSGAPMMKQYETTFIGWPLRNLLDSFKRDADNLTVPSYGHGDANISGAGSTASGLAMLQENANESARDAAKNFDEMIASIIRGMYDFNMMYSTDSSIKGDLRIVARGSSANVVKLQLLMRRNEFRASLRSEEIAELGSPVPINYGLRELMIETMKGLKLPVNKIFKERAVGQIPIQQQAEMGGNTQRGVNTKTLDAAGNPVSGQDYEMFKQKSMGAMQ